MVSLKSVDSLSRPDSSSSPLRQSVASEPLFWNAYVVICLSLPRPLTFTETTFKQTLGRLFLDVSTGVDSLKVHDTVTGWATKEGFGSMGAAAVLPTELWFIIAGPCSTLLAFTAGSVVFHLSGGWMRKWCLFPHPGFRQVNFFMQSLLKCPCPRQLPHNLFNCTVRNRSS